MFVCVCVCVIHNTMEKIITSDLQFYSNTGRKVPRREQAVSGDLLWAL